MNDSPPRVALIATLPKSGTWYVQTFLWSYGTWLQHPESTPALADALRERRMHVPPQVFGLDGLTVGHSVCPGFDPASDPRGGEWRKLRFPLPYDDVTTTLKERGEWERLDPARNPESRTVYLYRNPLDHFVSYFRHTQTHKKASQRTRVLPSGKRAPIRTLEEFVFPFGALSGFIKQFYTFSQMATRYPGQVLMLPYEQLTRDPASSFARVLEFLRAAPVTPEREAGFHCALRLSSKDSLSAIEGSLGRSLANDQQAGEKHIRDGRTGKWGDHFSGDDLSRIEYALSIFGLTLASFDVGDTRPALSPLANSDIETKVCEDLFFHTGHEGIFQRFFRQVFRKSA